MNYTCTMAKGKRGESWQWEIRLITTVRGQYEAEITGRGTSFHIIAGHHAYGRYLCIPNHDVGCELSSFTDCFWNTERLTRLLKEVDAVTVATGLCYLQKLSELPLEDPC